MMRRTWASGPSLWIRLGLDFYPQPLLSTEGATVAGAE